MAISIKWRDSKRQLVLDRRGIDFANLAELLSQPYLEDQRNDDPEQYRLVGFAGGLLMTYVVEYREDHVGEYIWVVTAWRSTNQEVKDYEENISQSQGRKT